MRQFKVQIITATGIVLLAAIVSSVSVRPARAGGAIGATLVRDVENGVQDPLQSAVTVDLPNGADFSEKVLVGVPAGKRLVIESVTAYADLPSNQRPFLEIITVAGGPTGVHELVFTQENLVDRVRMVAGESIKLYADPGSSVRAFFGREGGDSNSASCHVTISGHYVTL